LISSQILVKSNKNVQNGETIKHIPSWRCYQKHFKEKARGTNKTS